MDDFRTTLQVDPVSLVGGHHVNQDAYSWGFHADEYTGETEYLVAAVADGLGSAAASELIAQAAVAAAVGVAASLDYEFDPLHLIQLTRIVVGLHSPFAQHPLIFTAFRDSEPSDRCPDTALVLATVNRVGEVHIAWLGDCRAYLLLADGRLIRLARDHNLTAVGRSHVLTKTLRHGKPDHVAWSGPHTPGQRVRQLLLTTDGIHDALPDTIIRWALETAPTPDLAVEWLAEFAVRAAGTDADNATALLITLPPAATGPSDTANSTAGAGQ